ncbi:MAG: IS1634 family transposase [Gammaproteobacteria bacterium]|nr:IS1634 family transposase [Gammaproteobacteria bacterium]
MYVETVPNRNSPPAILLREGRREGKKVHKRTLANLSHWPTDKIERLRRVLKDEPLVHPDQLFVIEGSLPHGHVELLLEAVRQLKLPSLIDPRPSPQRDRVLAMILQRLLYPASKLATTRLWHTTTLGEELSVEDTDEDDLYEAMDWLLERQDRIERKLAKRHLAEGDPVLYDVSSSYYEGETCPLMQFGHNRDGRRDRPMVVYGVLADQRGRPLAVQAYAGNTGDPTTVGDQVEKVRSRFGLERVVLVGDRGLLTETQIDHLKRHPGLGWISALRHRQIRRLVESEAVQLSLFDQRHLAEVRSPHYPGERLIVCHNPILADHRRQKREALLKATEEALAGIARQVARRTRTPLSGTEIAEKVGRVKNRFQVAKHFQTEIADGFFRYERRREAITREAQLDGFYILRTSEGADRLEAAEVVRRYKDLTRVERAFRSLKTVHLEIRPIRHRVEGRVRAHLFLCLLAYYVHWHLRQALAPLLFDDEELEAERARRDPVLAAQPSESAKRKKGRGRSEEGLPLHSLETLMAAMGTRARHRCRLPSEPDGPCIQRLTEPTPLQQRALNLVRMFPGKST